MTTIRDAGISGNFVHQPLRDPNTEIRLIKVDFPSQDDIDVQCTLSVHSISNPPPYVAISYTWGDTSEKRRICLDGKQLYIGLNSWMVLWQVWTDRVPHPIWIDVLSIDQASEAYEEKSIQVGLMGMIFSAAVHVLVSVGSHASDSEFLVEQIISHAEHVAQKRKLFDEIEDSPLDQHRCSNCGQNPEWEEYICAECPTNKRFCQSCTESARRHQASGHRLHTENIEHLRFKGCAICGRQFATCWFGSAHTLYRQSTVLCRTCMKADDRDMDKYSSLIPTDHWGDVSLPTLRYRNMASALKTGEWTRSLSTDIRRRIVDAVRAFISRQYFSRLWIVQEVLLARRAIVACGQSLFPFFSLHHLAYDASISLVPDQPGAAHAFSAEFDRLVMLERNTLLTKDSLWTNVKTFRNQQCADSRDRAYALIALSQPALRGSLRPDYKRSTTEVFLQLLEQEAYSLINRRRSIATNIGSEVARSFRLDPLVPDIASMLEQRRSIWKNQTVDASLEDQDLDHRTSDLHRVMVHVVSHCTISKDESGKLIAPLLRKDPLAKSVGHDFQYVEINARDDAIRIRSPTGTVMAIADKKTRPGDTILLLAMRARNTEESYTVGLIVRATKSDVCSIIGQAVLNSGVQICHALSLSRRCCPSRNDVRGCRRLPSTNCACGVNGELHNQPGKSYVLQMSLEDFLLFVTQDIDLQERQSDADTASISVRPAHTLKRLETSVTSHWLSSYATYGGQAGEIKPKEDK